MDYDRLARYKSLFYDDESFPLIRNELSITLSKLEEKIEPSLKTQLKNYIIIRLVALLEHYFQNHVVNLIDYYHFKHNSLFVDDKISVSLSSLDKLQHTTKGKIIATNLQFHSSSDVDFVFSKLLDENFLDQVKKYPIKDAASNPFIQNWDKFWHIFDERHKIVHTSYLCEKYSTKQMRQIVDAAEWLTVLSSILIDGKIFELHEPSFKKNRPKLHQWLEYNVYRKPKSV